MTKSALCVTDNIDRHYEGNLFWSRDQC